MSLGELRSGDEDVALGVLVGGADEPEPATVHDQGARDPPLTARREPTPALEVDGDPLLLELVEEFGEGGDLAAASLEDLGEFASGHRFVGSAGEEGPGASLQLVCAVSIQATLLDLTGLQIQSR